MRESSGECDHNQSGERTEPAAPRAASQAGRNAAEVSRFQSRAGAGKVIMRRYLSRTRSALTALLAGAAVLCWSNASFAGTPTLGSDCGVGAALVGTSSDAAGKVTLGTPDPTLPVTGTCTLTFGVPTTNPPACSAINETNGGNFPAPMGTRTTNTTVLLGSTGSVPGDVISYSCADY